MAQFNTVLGMSTVKTAMANPEEKRKHPRLRREERAVIRQLNISGEDVTVSKYYCTTIDISPGGLQIHTKKPFALGEQVEITINLEGQGPGYNLSGITRWIAPSKGEPGFVLGIELINNNSITNWKHLFH
jgi:Tfp pilus assembly protein PilZ